MSTKVKGEAIKEGSIPLSALSNDIIGEFHNKYGLYDYKGTLGRDIKNIDTDISSYGSIFVAINNRCYELSKGVHDLSKLVGGATAYLNVYEKEYSLSIELQDTSGGYWDNISVYGNYRKIPTPDWRAQEGEAGYIENKPFRFITDIGYDYIFSNPLKKEDFESVPDGDGRIMKYRQQTDASYIQHVVCNKSWTNTGSIFDTMFHPIEPVNGKYRLLFGTQSASIYLESDGENNWLIVEVDYDDEFLPEDTVFVISDLESMVEYLTPSIEIPNTVIKTTPQTLSNTNKNQALTNLGIDPVVWKYLCEPYIIETGNTVPDYLVQLLLNDNPLILNLCKIKVAIELYDEVAGNNRPKVYYCTPIAYKWNDDTVGGLSLACIIFYNNAHHTYYADIDIYGNGEVYDIYEITE